MRGTPTCVAGMRRLSLPGYPGGRAGAAEQGEEEGPSGKSAGWVHYLFFYIMLP